MGSRGTAPLLLNGLWPALNSYDRRQPLLQFMHKRTHLFSKLLAMEILNLFVIFSHLVFSLQAYVLSICL